MSVDEDFATNTPTVRIHKKFFPTMVPPPHDSVIYAVPDGATDTQRNATGIVYVCTVTFKLVIPYT